MLHYLLNANGPLGQVDRMITIVIPSCLWAQIAPKDLRKCQQALVDRPGENLHHCYQTWCTIGGCSCVSYTVH